MSRLLPCLAFLIFLFLGSATLANEPIKVGVLYSQTGTMAISESSLKDAMLMLIAEQNRAGGLLGRKLEPVVLDPGSNWPMYGEQARQLIEREQVAAIFGCWTSVSRKEVKTVVEELNGLLFYPVQYEGREQSPNIVYLGASPNQQAFPAIQYLVDSLGIERWVLAATDYIYPRTVNRLIAAHLDNLGVSRSDIMIRYTPFGHADWERIVSDIGNFASQGKRTAVISTINGDANVAFYAELVKQGISADQLPVLAFSVGEAELQVMDAAPLQGHLSAWNYFMSLDNKANRDFIARWQAHVGEEKAVSSDPLEAQLIGFRLWVEAVKRAGSTETDLVRTAMVGLEVPNLSGGTTSLLENQHLHKPVYIGRITADGQYEVVWRSPDYVAGEPWFQPGTAKSEAAR